MQKCGACHISIIWQHEEVGSGRHWGLVFWVEVVKHVHRTQVLCHELFSLPPGQDVWRHQQQRDSV